MDQLRYRLLLTFIFLACLCQVMSVRGQLSLTLIDQDMPVSGLRYLPTKKSLTQTLEALSEQHKVVFFYDDELIRNKQISHYVDLKQDLEQVLQDLLPPLGLTYLKLESKTYVIKALPPNSSIKPITPEGSPRKTGKSGLSYPISPVDSKHMQAPLNPSYVTFLISGVVLTEDGSPLAGATVRVKGENIGTITNVAGEFSLEVPAGEQTIVISYIGYLSQEVKVDGRRKLEVVMAENTTLSDEIVVIGYGSQRKSDVSGSVASVKGEVLGRSKTPSLTNTIAGRLPGIVSKQTSGEPGRDGANITIRGFGSALVIVDGVQRSFNELNPEEVESVTILKDASAAIYGARAGNGVILVTTKRGKNTKPSINLNTTYTLQGYTFLPQAVNSGQYAELMNEFQTNDGLNPVYTEEEIETFYNGSDPVNYPNTDWWDLTMNDWSPQLQVDASLQGGNEKVKYFSLLSYLEQQGMYKSGDNKFKRYNIRTNLDAQITDNLTASLDLSVIVGDIKSPIRSVDLIWQDFYSSLPITFANFPDKSRVPFGGSASSPIAGTSFDLGGYRESINNKININPRFTYNIPGVDGLTLDAFGSYYENRVDFKNWQKSYITYQYVPDTDSYLERDSPFDTQLDQGYNQNSLFTINLSAKYKRIFGGKHAIDALALYERLDIRRKNLFAHGENFLTNSIDYLFASGGEGQTVGGGASQDGRISYVGRLNYNYSGKYYVQSTLRYDGSPRFNEENRWGLFPSVSAAWRISEENVIRNRASSITNLKLRASYSNLGYDQTGNFQYLSGYEVATGFAGPFANTSYVVDGIPINGIISTGLANPNITWEEMTIYNLGLDIGIQNNLLYAEIDAFYRERTGILTTRIGSLPNTFGADLPAENLNSLNNRGFEFLLGHTHKIGSISYQVSGNVSWTRAQWNHFEEPNYEDPDNIRINQRSGQWVNRTFAYLSDGLFTSQAEIEAHPLDQDLIGNATLRPGDIKYVDVSGPDGEPDGILDWRDQVLIGRSGTPELMYGLTFSMSYKGFDFDMLWQGASRFDVQISSNILPNSSRTPYQLIYDERWTPDNNRADALVPRLSNAGTFNNITTRSNFWYVDGTFLRLKNMNLGYSLPISLTSRVGIENIRVYVSGINLLTFSELNKWNYDPEGPNGSRSWYYPQQKTYSFGLSLTY